LDQHAHRDGRSAVFQALGPLSLRASGATGSRTMPSHSPLHRFCQDWGYGGLCLTNLFAFRARQSRHAGWRRRKPVGPEIRCLAAGLGAASSANGWLRLGPPGARSRRDCQATAPRWLFCRRLQVLRLGQNDPTHCHLFTLGRKTSDYCLRERSIQIGSSASNRSQPALLHQQPSAELIIFNWTDKNTWIKLDPNA